MNKMMKLLLVAEGCTLATMACEPGHWYVGGGVGMVYRTAKLTPKKISITKGDKICGVIVSDDQGDYDVNDLETERDASNEELKRTISKEADFQFGVKFGYQRTMGSIILGIGSGIDVMLNKLNLKVGNEKSFGRDIERVNPGRVYGSVRIPVSIPIQLQLGTSVTDRVMISINAGIRVSRARTKVKESVDNGKGTNLPNEEAAKLQASYNRDRTKSSVTLGPSLGGGITAHVSDTTDLTFQYEYSRTQPKIARTAMYLNGTPKIRVKQHGVSLLLTRRF